MVVLKINKHFLHGAMKSTGNMLLRLGMQGQGLQWWHTVDELDKGIKQKCDVVGFT